MRGASHSQHIYLNEIVGGVRNLQQMGIKPTLISPDYVCATNPTHVSPQITPTPGPPTGSQPCRDAGPIGGRSQRQRGLLLLYLQWSLQLLDGAGHRTGRCRLVAGMERIEGGDSGAFWILEFLDDPSINEIK